MLKWLKTVFMPADLEKEAPLVLDKPVVMKKAELTKMTKNDLEQLGRAHGIELDKRLTKAKLVDQLWKEVKPKK
jgi:hypothetical protein